MPKTNRVINFRMPDSNLEEFNVKSPEIGKKILYGVCGEGMGHAIRSGVIVKHLLGKNEVSIFAHSRSYDYLSEKFDNVHQIGGFNTVYEANQVNSAKTFFNGIKDLPLDLHKNITYMQNFAKEFQPDIIISDFEFYTNLLSKILRVPFISLDHTHVVTHCQTEVSYKYLKDKLKAEGVVRSFIQLPSVYLITSFYYPPLVNPGRVRIFPPVLRKRILRLKGKERTINSEEGILKGEERTLKGKEGTIKGKEGTHIFVYQTSTSNTELIKLLKEMDHRFIIYGFHKDQEDENLSFRSFNENSFYHDLASCQAVITNGGFNLISEALYLNKPVFSVPVKKQFEQVLNAIYLEKLGFGEFHEDPLKDDLEKFMLKLDFYRQNIKSNFTHDRNQNILQELDKLIQELTSANKQELKNKPDVGITTSLNLIS